MICKESWGGGGEKAGGKTLSWSWDFRVAQVRKKERGVIRGNLG
jgi:hypothetical protein